mmetsp:Transcript_149271/g.416059  ORF Transcript_149271/g.416059 Transcript_149271/m.416059 type:complete len:200 (-) Transcript_149271:630-1229(-)
MQMHPSTKLRARLTLAWIMTPMSPSHSVLSSKVRSKAATLSGGGAPFTSPMARMFTWLVPRSLKSLLSAGSKPDGLTVITRPMLQRLRNVTYGSGSRVYGEGPARPWRRQHSSSQTVQSEASPSSSVEANAEPSVTKTGIGSAFQSPAAVSASPWEAAGPDFGDRVGSSFWHVAGSGSSITVKGSLATMTRPGTSQVAP